MVLKAPNFPKEVPKAPQDFILQLIPPKKGPERAKRFSKLTPRGHKSPKRPQ